MMKLGWFYPVWVFCSLKTATTIKVDGFQIEEIIKPHQIDDEKLVVIHDANNPTNPHGFPINHTRAGKNVHVHDERLIVQDSEKVINHHGFPINRTGPDNYMLKIRRRRSTDRTSPHIEVLIMFDNELRRKIGDERNKQIEYFTAFMKNAERLFNTNGEIKFQFSISDVIAVDVGVENQLLVKRGGNLVSDEDTLNEIGKYLYNQANNPQYDIALFFTNGDLCSYDAKNSQCDTVTAGMAFVNGGCSSSDYFKKIQSTAIIEDTGAFAGVQTAVHEMLHLMNVMHDGDIGVPCPSGEGYVMDSISQGGSQNINRFKLSTCTIDTMIKFLQNESADCFFDEPIKGIQTPTKTKLPGELISLDGQCERDLGGPHCNPSRLVGKPDICLDLYCEENERCMSSNPAADGSPCEATKKCLMGECLSEEEIDKLLSREDENDLSSTSTFKPTELPALPPLPSITDSGITETENSILTTTTPSIPETTTSTFSNIENTETTTQSTKTTTTQNTETTQNSVTTTTQNTETTGKPSTEKTSIVSTTLRPETPTNNPTTLPNVITTPYQTTAKPIFGISLGFINMFIRLVREIRPIISSLFNQAIASFNYRNYIRPSRPKFYYTSNKIRGNYMRNSPIFGNRFSGSGIGFNMRFRPAYASHYSTSYYSRMDRQS